MSDRWTPFGLLWRGSDGSIRVATTRAVKPLTQFADIHDMTIRHWFSNLSPTGAIPTGPIGRHRVIVPDGWFGQPLVGILPALGQPFPPDGRTLQALKALLLQTVRLTVRTMAPISGTREGQVIRSLHSRPTLNESLLAALRSLSSQPPPLKPILRAAIRDLSLPAPTVSSGPMQGAVVMVRFPAVAHAMDLARTPVPGPGPWRLLQSGPDRVIETAGQLAVMKARAVPTILCGTFQPHWRRGSPLVSHLVGGRPPVFGQRFFTLGTIEVLLRHGRFHLEGILTGPPPRPNPPPPALELFLQGLTVACGGYNRTLRCLAANLVAHALLAALLDRTQTDPLMTGPGNAWLIDRDRHVLLPAFNAVTAAGGTVVEMGSGTLSFLPPRDEGNRRLLLTHLTRIGLRAPFERSQLCPCRIPGPRLCHHDRPGHG